MMQSLKEILRIIVIIVVGEYSKKKVNVYNLIISVSIKTFLLLEFFPSSDFYILSSFFFFNTMRVPITAINPVQTEYFPAYKFLLLQLKTFFRI